MITNHTIFLDFETFYTDDYSLRKMPTPNYILDPQFEVHMCAVADMEARTSQVIDGPDFGAFIAQYDPATTTTVTFNALFDNSILAWEYGFVPKMMLDSLGMCRALLGHKLRRFGLEYVLEHMGMPPKGGALAKVKGHRYQELRNNPVLWKEYQDYCKWDNEGQMEIFLKLIKDFPPSERRFMDLVIRTTVEPEFMLDSDMLRQHLIEVRKEKEDLLLDGRTFPTEEARQAALVVGRAKVMSGPKFQAALEKLGVEIEYKITPTGKTAPAFAKTDDFMNELQEHEDPRVQALVAARIGLKSTLEETRSAKLLSIAALPWSHYRNGNPRTCGTMPVPLRYGAAHTHRLGGDWKMNMQNLPTARGSKGKSKLRNALVAPHMCDVIAADLGQIEARLTAWITNCANLLEQFIKKEDPYANLASEIFKFKVNRKVHIVEGFIGKTGVLGLGYGCGHGKFFTMVTKMARAMDIDLGDKFTETMAELAVKTYRSLFSPIPAGWRGLDFCLKGAWLGKTAPIRWGPGGVVEIGRGYVLLPNGLKLQYDNPREDSTSGDLLYDHGGMTHKIYGAKFLENIVQALARIIVSNAALRINDRGFRFKLQAHDELVFICRKENTAAAMEIIKTEMVRRPSWAPNLPLVTDIKAGRTYADAK